MNSVPNYEHIIKIKRIFAEEQANIYLDAGWVLLNVESSQSMEHNWTTYFVLGWSKNNGQIVEPEYESPTTTWIKSKISEQGN